MYHHRALARAERPLRVLNFPNGEPPYLVPRMKQWVAKNYPGTKTAITEYNWGALNDITGAIAQAVFAGDLRAGRAGHGEYLGSAQPESGGRSAPEPACSLSRCI